MKVTVTGGAGFVGVHLVRGLLAQGHVVQVIDDFSGSSPARLPAAPRLRIDRVDVREASGLQEALDVHAPAVIIHLAARHFIPYCEAHPLETLEVNVRGTATVLRVATSFEDARLILASSLAVYPPREDLLREDIPLGPIDIYGYSKWQAELVARQIGADANLDLAIVRIGNVYGPFETNPHVIPHILEQVRLGDAIELGNLESRRDYIYVEDVVDALLALTARRPAGPEVFNLSTGEDSSVSDLLDEMGRLLNRTLRPQPAPHLLRPVDRPMLRADSSRLRAAVGWRPRHTLRDGLRKLLIAEGLLQA